MHMSLDIWRAELTRAEGAALLLFPSLTQAVAAAIAIRTYTTLHCTAVTFTTTVAAALTHSVAVVMTQTKRVVQYIAVVRGTYCSVN
jgi:hypothetical protein